MICTTLTSLIYGGRNNPAGTEVDIQDERQARRLAGKGLISIGVAVDIGGRSVPIDDPVDIAPADTVMGGPLGDMTITDAPDDGPSTTDDDDATEPNAVAPRKRGRPRKS